MVTTEVNFALVFCLVYENFVHHDK